MGSLFTQFGSSMLILQCMLAHGKPAYVTIRINDKKVARTTRERDRVWNQTLQVLCAHPSNSVITITLKTDCSILGKIHFQANQFLGESSLAHGSFPLESEPKRSNPRMRLQMILWFKPAGTEPGWQKLIGGGEFKGLRNASFPQRSNCHVMLYQDAHHMRGFKPPIEGTCGSSGPPRRLWEDVFKAIEGAKYLIYIVGWSLNPKMVLVNASVHGFLQHGLVDKCCFFKTHVDYVRTHCAGPRSGHGYPVRCRCYAR